MFYRIFLSLNVTKSKAESIPSLQNPPYNTNHAEARSRHPCLSSHAVIIRESNTSNKIKNEAYLQAIGGQCFSIERKHRRKRKTKKENNNKQIVSLRKLYRISFSLPYISF